MTIRTTTSRLGILLVAAALALTGCASTAGAGSEGGELSITDPWVKSAESGMSAAFGELENTGTAEVTVVSISSPASTMMELHETVDDGSGSMKMQEIDGGFVIPAGGTLMLEPGGNHFMLMDLTAPLVAGEEVSFTVTLSDGSTFDFTAPVKDFSGANEEYVEGGMDMGDDHDHSDHDHSEDSEDQ